MTNQVSEVANLHQIIDVNNIDQLPKRFRMTTSAVQGESSELPSLQGLAELRASGSGMFSLRGLQAMCREIGHDPLIIVDLRQESHGFVNGMAVSWYGVHNGANKGLAPEEAMRIEAELLNKLDQTDSIQFDQLENKSVDIGKAIEEPKIIQTEEQLVKSLGIGYKRFFVTDHHRPLDHVVDEFIAWVKALPNNVWLHFHCRGGVGRTSTFMNMYDMMHNAGDVSYDDIMQRHVLIGGKDFSKEPKQEYKVAPAIERIQFIQKFYEYCLACKPDGFAKSWSEWLGQ